MKEWRQRSCETNSINVNYFRTGRGGPPIVLLHGLMGSGECWTLLARAMEAEFDIVMPDARGHGQSSAPESGYRYDDLAADVLGLVQDLQLSRPVLIGHSMGGMTAAVAAQRSGATLGGLVLVDPTFINPELQRDVWESDVVDQHRRELLLSKSELVADARSRHPHRSVEIIEIQAGARLRTSLNAFEVLRPPNPDFRVIVGALDVPTLLVIGDSPVVSLELAAELTHLNPRVTVQQIPKAGHGLPFDQPEHLAQAVTVFLHRSA